MYCSRCGTGMGREQWLESIFCFQCGARLQKGLDPVDRVTIPSRSAETLRVVAGTVKNRPVVASVGSIGIGAAGIVAAPFLMLAGQWLTGLGIGFILLCWLTDSMDETQPCRGGARYGAIMAGAGVLTIGAGYVVLAVGVVSTLFGVGLGAVTGVKAYVDYRRTQRLIIDEPIIVEGGE